MAVFIPDGPRVGLRLYAICGATDRKPSRRRPSLMLGKQTNLKMLLHEALDAAKKKLAS